MLEEEEEDGKAGAGGGSSEMTVLHNFLEETGKTREICKAVETGGFTPDFR